MTTPDDGTTEGPKVPDFPDSRLAFRTWTWNPASGLLGSVVVDSPARKNWIAEALAAPAGFWPPGQVLTAKCRIAQARKATGDDEEHEVPDEDCRCGYYSTTDLAVVEQYLLPSSPVLGVVELGGKVVPAECGYRAQQISVKAILLVDPVLTGLQHHDLRRVAEVYHVPAIRPHSTDPEDYREAREVDELLGDMDAGLRELLGEDGETA